MKRILVTLYVLVGTATVAAGGIATALSLPAGPAAVSLLLLSAIVGLAALAFANRILYLLEHTTTLRVPVRDS